MYMYMSNHVYIIEEYNIYIYIYMYLFNICPIVSNTVCDFEVLGAPPSNVGKPFLVRYQSGPHECMV